jgi:hypothetical protein
MNATNNFIYFFNMLLNFGKIGVTLESVSLP